MPVSLRGGTTKQSQTSGGTVLARVIARRQRRSNLSQRRPQPQIASLAFAMTPQGRATAPESCHCEEVTTKQSQPALAPTPDCFTTVRNDTPKATPPASNRVIARRQRRSNLSQRWPQPQIASLPFAMTPQKLSQMASLRSQ